MFEMLLSNLLFSFNAVIPIFLIISIGLMLKRIKFINDDFSSGSNKIVFNIALPAMIFDSIYNADFRSVFQPDIILFSVCGTLIQFTLITAAAIFLISDKKAFGAFVQGSFRSNFVIIGIPLINNLSSSLGANAVGESAVIVSFIMPLYNILAVVILSSSSSERNVNWHKKVFFDIARNPLIIAVFLAIPFSLFNIRLPLFIEKTIASLAYIAVPLALLDIGASFNFKVFINKFRLAAAASCIKIALSPLVFTAAAYFLGFRGAELGILYILFASPTAISSYIMAKNMKNDADLAANIVLISTAGSLLTIFLGIFILKSIGWII